MIGVMIIVVLAALVGIWNNWILYDERMFPFRVNIFRFYFTLITNPGGTFSGKALRKYAIKYEDD